MEQVLDKNAIQSDSSMNDILKISSSMNGWLKFLGIINIVSGAFTALSIVGIIFAWLPIWLGVLLLQAGGQITNAKLHNDSKELVKMMEKLRLYFILQGIIFIVMIAFVLMGMVFMGGFLSQISNVLQDYQ
jgi:hypothetical protein